MRHWIYLLVDKSHVATFFEQFFMLIKNQFNKTIKNVRIENGTEFLPLKSFFLPSFKIFLSILGHHISNYCSLYSPTKWASIKKTSLHIKYCLGPLFSRLFAIIFLGRMCQNDCISYKLHILFCS